MSASEESEDDVDKQSESDAQSEEQESEKDDNEDNNEENEAPKSVIPPNFASELKGQSDIDYSSLINTSDTELWLFRSPKSFDISSLNGLSVNLSPATKQVCQFERDETKYALNVIDAYRQFLNVFPDKSQEKFTLGKPFTRQFDVTEVVDLASFKPSKEKDKVKARKSHVDKPMKVHCWPIGSSVQKPILPEEFKQVVLPKPFHVDAMDLDVKEEPRQNQKKEKVKDDKDKSKSKLQSPQKTPVKTTEKTIEASKKEKKPITPKPNEIPRKETPQSNKKLQKTAETPTTSKKEEKKKDKETPKSKDEKPKKTDTPAKTPPSLKKENEPKKVKKEEVKTNGATKKVNTEKKTPESLSKKRKVELSDSDDDLLQDLKSVLDDQTEKPREGSKKAEKKKDKKEKKEKKETKEAKRKRESVSSVPTDSPIVKTKKLKTK